VTRLVLATANPDKAAEIRAVLDGAAVDLELVARPPEVPEVEETGSTLVENARLKAEALRDATGLAALGEDTGLEVDALGGAPGVRSARYAGASAGYRDNVAKLLADVTAVHRASRTARFRTVIVVAWPDGSETVVDGTVEGVIVDEPRGAGCFGYDPVFAPAGGGGLTFAELPAERKHAISHRGRALRALVARLREAGPDA
jgi:XTP/dITP diphosphohydrolase